MADLITLTDITSRMPEALTPSQQSRVTAYITDASGLIRAAAPGLLAANDEVVVLRMNAGRLLLPGLPVISIASVYQVGVPTPSGDILIPVGAWRFDGIDSILLDEDAGNWIINLSEGWWSDSPSSTYRVTYSHGFVATPAEIVTLAANMVIRVLTSPTMAEGLTGENIGQYGWQMNNGSGGQGTGVRLTENDRLILERFCRHSGVIETPVS